MHGAMHTELANTLISGTKYILTCVMYSHRSFYTVMDNYTYVYVARVEVLYIYGYTESADYF